MDQWTGETEKENTPLSSKKLKLSLTKNTKQEVGGDSARWHFLSAAEEESLSERYVPKNTASSTKWAVSNFQEWQKCRNERSSADEVPEDILECTQPDVLCKWLSLYVAETRKKDGSQYPPKSIYILLTGILRRMRQLNPQCPNFLDVTNQAFASFHASLDNVFRELRFSGVGSATKHAEVFTKEEESQLWEKDVIGTSTPKQLLRAVFFLNGKNFCLRGGEEHRHLKLSQLKRCHDPDHYVYTENTSKNRSGGMAQMRMENKVVPVYASVEAGLRCHVYILDLYFSKLPPRAVANDVFYLQPLQKTDPGGPWFSVLPVGRNTLSTMVKTICAEAGVGGNKTNHSLRATGTSTLFQAGVPEKIIQQRSGHLSLHGLRHYEHVTAQQQLAVCRVLSSSENTTFTSEREKEPEMSRQQSAVSTGVPAPQMHFSGCTVNIYQGQVEQPPSTKAK